MTSKTLSELTSVELRAECAARGLSISGTKPDLIIRLEQEIRDNGQEPEDVRFNNEREPNMVPTLVEAGACRSDDQQPVESLAVSQRQQTPTDSRPGQSRPHLTTHPAQSGAEITKDIFETAAAQIKQLRLTMPSTSDTQTFETRLRALEASMTRFYTETRSISFQQPQQRAAPRFQDHTSPVQITARTHGGYQAGTPYEYNNGNVHQSANRGASNLNAGNNTTYFTREPLNSDHPGHQNDTPQYASYSYAHAQERSVLIPYDDLRAARSSLPEYTGTRAEDPVRYIAKTESILGQARIHPTGWCRAVEPQLKGTASTWYTSIKALDLSWEEFKVEFFENFNNSEIQSQLRADIVSTRQTPRQSLTEFVLIKNQLARRVNTGLSEPELVGIIAGLTRDTFLTHIRLHRPVTFSELRRIASVLDPVTENTKHPPQQWTPRTKKGAETPQKSPPVKKKTRTSPPHRLITTPPLITIHYR